VEMPTTTTLQSPNFQNGHLQRQAQHTNQFSQIAQQSSSSKVIKPSPRDPRFFPMSYAQVTSNQSHYNSFASDQPSISSPLLESSSIHNNLTETLNSFFNRFQELLTPLISTLNLVISKLLQN
jgi:hypothetical protein